MANRKKTERKTSIELLGVYDLAPLRRERGVKNVGKASGFRIFRSHDYREKMSDLRGIISSAEVIAQEGATLSNHQETVVWLKST